MMLRIGLLILSHLAPWWSLHDLWVLKRAIICRRYKPTRVCLFDLLLLLKLKILKLLLNELLLGRC